MSTRAAIRYAKAFLKLSNKENNSGALKEDMQLIFQTILENEKLKDFLENPIVKDKSKVEALNEIFKDSQKATKNLLQLLLENKRLPLLADIAEQFLVLYSKQENKETAYVTTAVAIDDELKTQILAKAKEISPSVVAIESKVDPSLIGGFIIRVGDQLVDTSIATKIKKLRNSFVQ